MWNQAAALAGASGVALGEEFEQETEKIVEYPFGVIFIFLLPPSAVTTACALSDELPK